MRPALLALCLPLLAACGTSADEGAFAGPGDVERGRALVLSTCSGCHATGRTGDSPYPSAPPFRVIAARTDVENLAEAFAEGIVVGHQGDRQMPEFQLSPGEIEDLIAYLKSLQGPGAAAAPIHSSAT